MSCHLGNPQPSEDVIMALSHAEPHQTTTLLLNYITHAPEKDCKSEGLFLLLEDYHTRSFSPLWKFILFVLYFILFYFNFILTPWDSMSHLQQRVNSIAQFKGWEGMFMCVSLLRLCLLENERGTLPKWTKPAAAEAASASRSSRLRFPLFFSFMGVLKIVPALR